MIVSRRASEQDGRLRLKRHHQAIWVGRVRSDTGSVARSGGEKSDFGKFCVVERIGDRNEDEKTLHQRCLADEPTRNVILLCRSGLGSKIDTQGFSALIYQLCGQ